MLLFYYYRLASAFRLVATLALSFSLLLWLILLSLPGQAQQVVRGIVVDADTKQPLPTVTIRLQRVRLGTSSGDKGTFSVSIPDPQQQDTLLISRLGYVSQAVPLASVLPGQVLRLYLRKQPTALSPVAVTGRGWTEQRVGITSAKALVHFTDGTLPAGQPFEIAQLMRVGTAGAVVTSVNLYLAADTPDSLTLGLRFYRFEEDRPTTLLVAQPITQRVAIQQGWLRLDLTRYNLYLPQDFVLGLTFQPDRTTGPAVPYEIKIGGNAKSFARPAGQAEWRVPPHHYRLYITARLPAQAASAVELNNAETPASTHLYSEAVGDSFALFVRLPRGYARSPTRRYPVVVLLDGNVYVEQLADALRTRPRREGVILVGVGRRDFGLQDSLRQRDYTYPAASEADSLPLSGGGRHFLAFLKRDLLPYLDRTYRTDSTTRTLMGHSLGGYFTLWALVEEWKSTTPAFTHYVAASPSLYYVNEYVRRELATLPASAAGSKRQVYLTFGARELGATVEGTVTKASLQGVLAELSASRFSTLAVEHQVYADYGHMETAVPTFIDGLKRLFRPAPASR
jgi:predicted alpha/beta superfamily hydrolase